MVFNKCKACHAADRPKNKVGPNLVGLFGRPAGTVEGFKYSEAMKEFGHHLGRATLADYSADPRGFIKGNRMAFVGLKNARGHHQRDRVSEAGDHQLASGLGTRRAAGCPGRRGAPAAIGPARQSAGATAAEIPPTGGGSATSVWAS